MKTICIVVGARPNFVKVAPLIRAIEKTEGVDYQLVYAGHEDDPTLEDSLFDDLIRAERSALFEHLVHQRLFPVVDVCNYRYISNIFLLHMVKVSPEYVCCNTSMKRLIIYLILIYSQMLYILF